MIRRPYLVLLLVVALLLGACGGGDSTDDSPTIGTDDSPGQAGPPTPTAAGETTTSVAPGRKIAAPWAAPTKNVAALIAKAGLPALPGERLEYHIHAHLDVFVDGKAEEVPANLGIAFEDNGQLQAISPLHTHDDTGIIHVENEKPTDFFLGQLFTEWDVRLDATCVGSYCRPQTTWAVYVDGTKDTGDPRMIQFAPHRQIAIVIGKAPGTIPGKYDWPAGV